MAGYDQLLSELGGGQEGRELQALVSRLLGGAGVESQVVGSGGSGLLRNLLEGLAGSVASGNSASSASTTNHSVASAVRSFGVASPLPALESQVSRAISGVNAVPLPLRGVAGLLGGLFGLIQRDSASGQTEGLGSTAFEFPAARKPSLAIGPDRYGGAEFDYRFDGQPRRLQQDGQGERRVEIHIQALDARSLLDRKEELAEAVRQAMSSSGTARETLLGY